MAGQSFSFQQENQRIIPHLDQHTLFASPSFDPNEYASTILAGDPYLPNANKGTVKPTGEDIGVAIHKLNTGIDDVEREIKSVVSLFLLCLNRIYGQACFRLPLITRNFSNTPLQLPIWAFF